MYYIHMYVYTETPQIENTTTAREQLEPEAPPHLVGEEGPPSLMESPEPEN